MAAVNFLTRCKYRQEISIMQDNKQEKSPIKQRILLFLSDRGVTPYEFYKNTGVTRGILTQNNGISEDNISRFLAYFPEVNIEWLMTGKGEMLKTKHTPEALIPENEPIPSNKDNKNETIKQESPINILLSIIREKDDKLQEQAEEIGRLRERVEQLECIKETKERPVSGAQSSGLADVG